MATDVSASPSIVASAAAGDQGAFALIVAEHHDDMVRVAFLVCRDVDLAHEATQSAWSIAWRKLGSLKDEDRLRPWLMSIAANEARQLIRRRNRQSIREIGVDATAELPASRPPGQDDSVDLMNALGRLSPDDRAIVAMRYLLGFTSDEIGKATGLSAPGVRSRLARSVARLRKDLTDD